MPTTLKTMGVIGAAAALLLSAGVALAEEEAAVNTTSIEATVGSPASTAIKAETERAAKERIRATTAAKKAEIERTTREAKERMRAATESAAAARKTIATTTRAEIREIKQITKERVETIRETAKERVEAVREEVKDRVKAEREKAKARVANVQDKKRQEMMQKLAERFENLNNAWTNEFAKKLDRFNAMLQKMENRVATAAANGKEVTAATAAIQTARNVVVTAQTAVTAQAAKTYLPDTSTLTTTAATSTPQGQEELTRALKVSFQTLHSTLFKDLFALRDGPMTVARKAVQDALTVLTAIPGVDEKSTSATLNQ